MSLQSEYYESLYHHGVKGMKWGVRKKASKAYKKEMIAYQRDSLKNANRLWVDAHNKTADEYNNGKIEEYNRTHDPDSKTYMDDYEKQFTRDWQRNFDKMKLSEMENNPHYKKAQALVEKYGLLEFDKLAQDNAAFVSELRRQMSSGGTSWDMID